MYNSVTQVVYFHFPSYKRRRQTELEAIQAGLDPVACLGVAMELQPTVQWLFEDDPVHTTTGLTWMLVAGGALYLLAPKARTVWTGECIWAVLKRGFNETE